MYLSLKFQNKFSSNLSKITVMPFAITGFLPTPNKFLRVKKRVMLKLESFTNFNFNCYKC